MPSLLVQVSTLVNRIIELTSHPLHVQLRLDCETSQLLSCILGFVSKAKLTMLL